MNNIKHQVFIALCDLARLYRKETIPQETLEMYTEFLVDELTVEELRRGFKKIILTCKFFPSIAEIVELARPKATTQDEAILIANKILECARSFSLKDIEGAKEFLGDLFPIAQRFGWRSLVELENSDLNTARAQLRDLAKAHLNFSRANPDFDLSKLCSAEVPTPLLTSLRDTLSIVGRE